MGIFCQIVFQSVIFPIGLQKNHCGTEQQQQIRTKPF